MFLSAGEYVTKTTARHSDQFSLLLSSSLSGFNFVGLRKFCFITHCCQQVTSNQVMGKMFNKFVVILSVEQSEINSSRQLFAHGITCTLFAV